MAQRSIMARTVMAPVELAVRERRSRPPVSPSRPCCPSKPRTPGLDSWEPDRWARHRLADTSALASPQLVTAFGHGRHTCPAQPFSLAAMTAAVTHLFGHYELTPGWASYPAPVPAQIGGVARAAAPAPVTYSRRQPQAGASLD